MTEIDGDGKGYRAAMRAAAVISDPPARITTSWRCPECDQMNRTGPPVQGTLFTPTATKRGAG